LNCARWSIVFWSHNEGIRLLAKEVAMGSRRQRTLDLFDPKPPEPSLSPDLRKRLTMLLRKLLMEAAEVEVDHPALPATREARDDEDHH